MTPQQRDDLAEMAGGIHDGCGWKVHGERYDSDGNCHFGTTGWLDLRDWHPELSLDDCQPLFVEIEQRGVGSNLLL